LKLRTPLQIHKTALLAPELHEAFACFGLRRTRAAWPLIKAVCHLVQFYALCFFSRRRTLAVEQIQIDGVAPPSTKLLDAPGYDEGLKCSHFSLDDFLYGILAAGGKQLTLRWSICGLTTMSCAQQYVLNTDGTLCGTNLAVYEWQKGFSSLFLSLFFDRFIGSTPVNVFDPVQWCP
jgi:hypothetical protein